MRAEYKKQFNELGRFLLILCIVFFAALIVRLPHLLSSNSFFDGDEAVIGIMAQCLLKGDVSIFFLGQNYGFSLLESSSVALFLKFIGTGIWALRLGGLLLFSLGVTFIIQTFKLKGFSAKALIFIGLLLISFPTWYLWGMMVRGGYVSSFLLISILFYITEIKYTSIKWIIVAGIISGVSFESHVLILLTFTPILLNWLLKASIKWKAIFLFSISGVASILVCKLFYIDNPVWYKPELSFGFQTQWDQLVYHLGDIISGFSNYHFFTAGFKLTTWLSVIVIGSFILFLISLIKLTIDADYNDKRIAFLFLPILIIYLFFISMMRVPAPRYWVGLFTGMMFLLLFLLLRRHDFKVSFLKIITLTFFIVVALMGGNHRRDWYQTDKNEMLLLAKLHDAVVTNNVDFIYSVEPDFQWKWNYMYGNEIPAMHVFEKERTAIFINRIETLKLDTTVNIGVVGFKGIYNGLNKDTSFYTRLIDVEDKYFLYLNPSEIEYNSFKAFYK